MRGYRIRFLLLPLLLAAGLTACASNGVQPGIVYTSSARLSRAGRVIRQMALPGKRHPPRAGLPRTGGSRRGRAGRVDPRGRHWQVGGGGGGGGNGAFMGGLLGAGAGATIGAITSQTLGGGIVGAVLGMVGGAIAGTIADGRRGAGRGIEVTVQRDDGQQVTVAQRDDGDIQLGDRVQVVQNRQGRRPGRARQPRAPD